MVRHALPRWMLLLGFVLLASGCDVQPEGGFTIEKAQEQVPKKTRRMRIGVVLPMYSHPFFVAQKKGIERKAEELDVLVEVRDGQDSDRTQIAQVEALLNVGVDALVLCPRDEEALVPAVASANRARVPVVALNRRVNGGRLVCYVGADDVQGGKAQGQALVDALGPQGGNILYLQGTQGSSPQRQRAEGFRKVLAEHPEITIADERFADFQEDKAKAVMTNLVQRFRPGKIQAIVAQSDEMALPASEVCRAEGWKDVIVIGFDGTRAAFDAIKAGTLYATVLQSAAQQGAEALEVMVESLKGKYVRPERITPLPVVTRANVDRLEPAY